MALRKPLVLIGGVTHELPVGDTVSIGAAVDIGLRYNLQATTKVVPVDFQYLIHGVLNIGTGIIRAEGQVVVI